MNFTEGFHDKLCGSSVSSPQLDPGLIMDLRHESVRTLTKVNKFPVEQFQMFQIKNRKLRESSSRFKFQKELNMENIKNHNNLVESRMIANELSKFKLDIRKLSAKSNAASQKYVDSLDSCDEDSEETKLLDALRESEDGTFAYTNDSKKIVVEKKKRKAEVHEISYEEGSGLSGFSGSTATMSEGSQERAVHFEGDFIKVSTQPKPAYQEEFQEYYEIAEDCGKFNDDEELDNQEQRVYDDCFMCCNDADCQFGSRSFDMQSFYSMPNLGDGDIGSLMKITKFQSMVTVETTIQECVCCPPMELHGDDERFELLNKSIEEAETEKMLIVRRMEIEEKNYQELVIMSNANSKNISDSNPFECEKIISDLFTENQEKPENVEEKRLMRRCFKDWLQKTTVAKILKTNAFTNEDRVKKINCFLNKIRLEQNKVVSNKSKKEASKAPLKQTLSSRSTPKAVKKDYEHKMKVQQDIIELQKLKIQRQERLITEMKLVKFSEMLKESKNDLKMELINAKRGNTKLRVKARCIELAANIKPDPEEEERRKMMAQGLMVPKFLQKMQDRAIERLTRHEEARERRLRLENEKDEIKNQIELSKRMEDEEGKRKRLLEMREKRRQEKIIKQLKEQERLRFQENLKRAKDHYTKSLMKQLGFRAFQLMIRLKRTNHRKSMIFRRKMCMKKCFNLWFINAKIVWDNKRAQADRLHEISLVRGRLTVWKHVHNIHKKKFLVAIDWYEVRVSEKLLKCWIQFSQQSKFIESNKMKVAEAHFNW